MGALSRECLKQDAKWQKRSRLLNTLTILKFLFCMVGKRSTSYRKACALGHFENDKWCSLSSLCKARYKISWAFFRKLLQISSNLIIDKLSYKYLWNGRLIYSIDASRLNLPKELKSSKYKGSNKNCFYPQGLLTSLVLLKANIHCNFIFSRRMSELASVDEHLRHVKPGGIVVYDRLYFTINTLCSHLQQGIDGVFRLKTKTTLKEVMNFIESGEQERIEIIKRKNIEIKIRFLRYKIGQKEYYLATTLLDTKKYTRSALKGLYHKRWGIEEAYKHIKYECGLEEFHTKKSQGVKQEIAVSLILAALNEFLASDSMKTKRTCKGVSNTLLNHVIYKIWTKNSIVRKELLDKLVQAYITQRCNSPPGRSFFRKSHKVISRWQKNIAGDWDKKKRLQNKGF